MPKVTANGIQINYEIQGHGDPVLMIMGITAPGSVWEAHANEWSQEFQCIMPDNRGVGETDAPEGPYSSEMMADDMAALIDELKVGPVAVVGCSMGSIIAQVLALKYPEKVSRLVLMCPWARCDRRAVATFEHLVTMKRSTNPEEMMKYVQLLIFSKHSWDNDEVYQTMVDGQSEAKKGPPAQTLTGLEGQAAACINHSVLDDLATIKAPTLVIGGEDDQFTPRWMAEEIHERLPESTLHLYPTSGHAFHWENLDDFNARVGAFIKAKEAVGS